MNDLQLLLIFFGLFITITTILNLYTRDKQILIKNKFKVQFTVGGVLLFLGKSRKPLNPKPLGKGVNYGLITSIIIGITLFYIMLLPRMIEFISEFIKYTVGVTTATPEPVIVPAPLLFRPSPFLPYPPTYIIIALIIAIVVHEVAHAIVALREGVSLKSWGVGFILLIPIAFVELDESELNSAPIRSKLNIVSAGVFANAMVSALFFITIVASVFLAQQFFGTPIQVVTISGIDCSICNTTMCPAKLAKVDINSIVVSVNNTLITSLNHLVSILRSTSIGSNLSMYLCNVDGECWNTTIHLSAHRKNNTAIPCIGVIFNAVTAFTKDSKIYIAKWFENLVMLLDSNMSLNFSLFVLNSIPLFITDGSLFLRYFFEKRDNRVSKLFTLKIIDIVNSVTIAMAIVISSYIMLTLG